MNGKISLKDWKHGFTTRWEGGSGSLNIDVDQSGVIRPRKSWVTFAGMVHQLWLINQRYQKLGIQGDFTVRLPLKAGGFRKSVGVRANTKPKSKLAPAPEDSDEQKG